VLKKEEFITLRDFIYEKCGIFFAENKMYLMESRLTNRLNELGMGSFEDYYYFLKYGGPSSKNELYNLFDVVTTNETSFFRNPPQLEAFKVIIQKNYLNNNTGLIGPLRIWSAACSTGEEPYTLAIMLMEMIEATRKNLPFTIVGTDISQKVIDSARRAVYGTYSVRSTGENMIRKYFAEDGANFRLKDTVKKYVKIDYMNLMEDAAYKVYRQMDVIFCRNVLIYFDDKMKRR
jgi:Methylase of chemotaxis methyl-accepting proteins